MNLGQHITELRKKADITQEQLASALHISSQAVSKWETDTCQPDTMTLPLIAEFFHVSIDYLFYGEDIVYDDIYQKVQDRIVSHQQMDKESYEDALKIFASAHHGITHGNMKGEELMYDEPSHISNENGLSLLSGRGYGAIVTEHFFETMNISGVEFFTELFHSLAKKDCVAVIMAVISMDDISFGELREKLGFNENQLRSAIDYLIPTNILIEKKSKHKSLGTTYQINGMYHSCICVLLATAQMQQYTLGGISCCMGYGDYPIQF